MRAYGQLLRLSLTASALADAAAGVLLGSGTWPRGASPWLMLLASACVYHGGMALNDWADRSSDSTRPNRPIASGAIRPNTAFAIGAGLLIAGPLVAFTVDPAAALLLLGVAVLAALYDLWGRGPWLGPTLLGLCRAGNLGAGILAGAHLVRAPGSVPPGWVALASIPLAYGLYVFLVSRLGRLEDGEDSVEDRRVSPSVLIACIGLVLALVCVLPAPEPRMLDAWPADARRYVAFALGAAGARALFRRAAQRRAWRAADILPVMGMALRRLLVFTAAAAVLAGSTAGWIGAALILAGFPLSFLLRRAFPPS